MFYYKKRDGWLYCVGSVDDGVEEYFIISSLLILDFMGFEGYRVGGNGSAPLEDFVDFSGLSAGRVNLGTTCCDVEFHLGYVLETPGLERYRGMCFYVLPHMSIGFNLLRGGGALGRASVVLSTLVNFGITFSWDVLDSSATDVVVRFLLDVFRMCCDGWYMGETFYLKVLYELFPGLQSALLRFFALLRENNIFWWDSDGLAYGGTEAVVAVVEQWVSEYEELWGRLPLRG